MNQKKTSAPTAVILATLVTSVCSTKMNRKTLYNRHYKTSFLMEALLMM